MLWHGLILRGRQTVTDDTQGIFHCLHTGTPRLQPAAGEVELLPDKPSAELNLAAEHPRPLRYNLSERR